MAQGAAADRHVQRQLQKIATCHASSSQGGGGQFAGVHELISGTMNAMDVSAPALCASGDWYLSVDDCAAPRSHDARRHADLVGSAGLEGNFSSPLARHGGCPWILRLRGKNSRYDIDTQGTPKSAHTLSGLQHVPEPGDGSASRRGKLCLPASTGV
ncbi:hypothetical protein SNOG_05655 [Parastagonospora nodorum SN15]|uniref:Uncharacterized protein n=1 Tax=Phaeosphaeria nodorum (strain SN15 / ATCC MYA-4574 / FGSC 10173) TaxID=321614 RepID=Q0URF9_PHANO|nr:hypothetical protein SNOG_05655 [Parastagonospora nodorum SN15]EAT86719.1 hypothetical protein SNOG_05655 [Parastagonospora nodorum SN15]